MALGEDIPIHTPVLTSPGSGLSGGLRFLVDSGKMLEKGLIDIPNTAERIGDEPNGTGLELTRSTGDDSRGKNALLAAILNSLRDRGERSRMYPISFQSNHNRGS